MVPGIDPKVDYPFKRLIGTERNRVLLIDLLNAVLRRVPAERVVDVELRNPFNSKDTLDDKLSIVDIKARDQLGRVFNVEMQGFPQPGGFPRRLLYYWARLYGEQLREGHDYALLKPTISISFVDYIVLPDAAAHHLFFRLWDTEQRIGLTDDLAFHLFQLPRFDRTPEQLTDPLDVWLYFLRHGQTPDTEALPRALDIVPIHQAMVEMTMLSRDDLERERYEARLKVHRDAISLVRGLERELVEKTAKALAEGLAAGLAEGLGKGALIGRIHLSQRLLQQVPTLESELLPRSQDELARLAEELEQELLSRPR